MNVFGTLCRREFATETEGWNAILRVDSLSSAADQNEPEPLGLSLLCNIFPHFNCKRGCK